MPQPHAGRPRLVAPAHGDGPALHRAPRAAASGVPSISLCNCGAWGEGATFSLRAPQAPPPDEGARSRASSPPRGSGHRRAGLRGGRRQSPALAESSRQKQGHLFNALPLGWSLERGEHNL